MFIVSRKKFSNFSFNFNKLYFLIDSSLIEKGSLELYLFQPGWHQMGNMKKNSDYNGPQIVGLKKHTSPSFSLS